MTLSSTPSDPSEERIAPDKIPAWSFHAPQTLAEFMGLLEEKTLEYVNEVCSNVILDTSEKQWVSQSRLRKFVVQGASTMRNPEKTFCVPSLIERKKAEGWDISRIQHYIELAALTGQVPTDKDNRYHSGFEGQLGNYLVKAQYYQQKDTVAEYDELWRNGWHIYENIAMQVPCLEPNVLPTGYSIALATAEEDAHQKIDFFLKNDATGEKIGVQFTIDRSRVDMKLSGVRLARKDTSQTAAVLGITPGGVHRNISDLMMSGYKQKQDILFAERMKKHFPDNYAIFCNQLRQAFAKIVSSQAGDDITTGIMVRILPGSPVTSIHADDETDTIESATTTIKKEDLPVHMQSVSGFEWAWRDFLSKLNTAFLSLLSKQPTTESNRADIINGWNWTKYTYSPSDSFEDCMVSFIDAINEFIADGDSKEYKKRRVGNFQDLMEALLWAKATKMLLPVINYTVNRKNIMAFYDELGQSGNETKTSAISLWAEKSAWIQIEIDVWNTFLRNPSPEGLISVAKSTQKIIEIVRSLTTVNNKYLIEQHIEQHLNEADMQTALADPQLISCIVPEINALLTLLSEWSDLVLPQIEMPDTFDSSALVSQVTESIAVTLETSTSTSSSASLVSTSPETVQVDPKVKLRERIDGAQKLVLQIQAQIDALIRSVADVTSELWIFQSEKTRIETEISQIIEKIVTARKALVQQISTTPETKIIGSGFYTDMIALIQSANKAENQLTANQKTLQQKLSECERHIASGKERLTEAQKKMETEKSHLEQEKASAEASKIKYESALQVLAELD